MYVKSFVSVAAVILGARASAAQATPTDPTTALARCRDGSYSRDASPNRACSSHAGVGQWLTPIVATAQCGDGTLSASASRTEACSQHGGLAEWLVPVGATAHCADDSYSAAGACAGQGGVTEWYAASTGAGTSWEDEQSSIAAMQSDLRNLVVAEEAFFVDSVKYTTTIGLGGLSYKNSAGNSIPHITLTDDGWVASITNARMRTTCVIFVGSTVIPPAQKEAVPACSRP
ncbi:MAG TPA: DUF3761 domain-containing protein [Gemmatimonadales bacterium]|nr:DUF3761 domain-containing protein [Gemmatimonadales bacterium]